MSLRCFYRTRKGEYSIKEPRLAYNLAVYIAMQELGKPKMAQEYKEITPRLSRFLSIVQRKESLLENSENSEFNKKDNKREE